MVVRGQLAARDAEQLDGTVEHGIENLRQLELTREIRERIEQRLLFFGALSLRCEEPRVFDRHRGLVGQDLHQAHVVVVETAATLRDQDRSGR